MQVVTLQYLQIHRRPTMRAITGLRPCPLATYTTNCISSHNICSKLYIGQPLSMYNSLEINNIFWGCLIIEYTINCYTCANTIFICNPYDSFTHSSSLASNPFIFRNVHFLSRRLLWRLIRSLGKRPSPRKSIQQFVQRK